MYFKLPEKIQWYFKDGVLQSKNTFITYTIQFLEDCVWCYYGNGRFKEFGTEQEAQEWVANVHYPSQVAKYFTVITEESL